MKKKEKLNENKSKQSLKFRILISFFINSYIIYDNKKIVLSNIEPFREIINYDKRFYFDPENIKDISKKVDEDVDYQVVIDRINRLCTI